MFIDPLQFCIISISLFATASKTLLRLTDYIILSLKLSNYAIILVMSFKTEKNVFQLKPIDAVK